MPEHKRAVIYARVSTIEQATEGQSIDAQLKTNRAFASHEGWELVGEYKDEGASARTADRPEFQRMIADAKRKSFDIIIVHKLDRFARSREDSIVYKSLLKRDCGVEVVSVTEPFDDSPVSVLMKGILECIAEFYSLNLAQEVKKGMREAATKGLALGMAPLGYKIGEDGKYEVAPEEAAIVRRIFSEYSDGKGMRQIARDLIVWGKDWFGDAANYKWSANGIGKILSNPVYTGDFVWGKRDVSKGRKFRDASEWIRKEGAHEAIISKELFDRVQRIRGRNISPCRAGSRDYMLRGLVYCAECGARMYQVAEGRKKSGQLNNPWQLRCATYSQKGFCYYNHIAMVEIDTAVIDALEQISIGKSKSYSVKAKQDSTFATKERDITLRLESIPARFDRQMQAFEAGVIDLEQLKTHKERLENERKELEKQLAEIRTHKKDVPAELVQEKVGDVVKILKKDIPVDKKRRALEEIIDRIEYSRKEDTLQIRLVI